MTCPTPFLRGLYATGNGDLYGAEVSENLEGRAEMFPLLTSSDIRAAPRISWIRLLERPLPALGGRRWSARRLPGVVRRWKAVNVVGPDTLHEHVDPAPFALRSLPKYIEWTTNHLTKSHFPDPLNSAERPLIRARSG